MGKSKRMAGKQDEQISNLLPSVPIILITSTRTRYAVRTVAAARDRLKYDGRLLWYIAADNSNEQHVTHILAELATERIAGIHYTTGGYGETANLAWRKCREALLPVTFWLEDDWELQRELDITPAVRLFGQLQHVGCVRYSYLPTGLECDAVGHEWRMYLQIRKTRPYAFSGNPHLKHERFVFYGDYPEGMNPGDTEIHYDGQIRQRPHDGPSIWWPLAIGDAPPFRHIGDEKSY